MCHLIEIYRTYCICPAECPVLQDAILIWSCAAAQEDEMKDWTRQDRKSSPVLVSGHIASRGNRISSLEKQYIKKFNK